MIFNISISVKIFFYHMIREGKLMPIYEEFDPGSG
jgi:hypothetical protein